MEKSRLLSSLKLFLVSVAAVRAFSPVANVKSSHSSSALSSEPPSQHDVDEDRRVKMLKRSDFFAAVGTFVTGAIVSRVEPSHAANVNPSSSMYLSEEIKTLDFSLPSSYDSINSLKASAKALGVEDAPEDATTKIKAPKKKKEESSGGGGLGSVLPSMKKSGPSKKPPKEKVKKPKPVKEAPAAKEEFETMDMGLPSYSDSTGSKGKSVFAL